MNNDSAHDSQLSSSLTPWHWGWSAALALIVLVTLAFRYALPVRDGDLWFHMLYGKYFLEHHTLIADHTIFSWTPTTNDTIYCTWLPDIFLYLLHKAAGLPGIFAFRYLCMLVPVLGCFLYARKLKIASHPLTWLLCLLAVIMSYTAAFEKPEILSFVFMTLLAWNWWHIRSSGEDAWKNCYVFPMVMLVWVNTHGGFVFGAAFLVLIGLGELLNTWLSPQNILPLKIRKHLAIALLLAAIMPLLTPYGYRYPLQLIYDFLPTDENLNYNNKIASYRGTFFFEDSYNFSLCADLAIGLLLILYWRNFRKVEWSSLLTNLVFAFLYTKFYRTTFYWVPVFLFSSLNLLALHPLLPVGRRGLSFMSRLFPLFVITASLWLSANTLYKAVTMPELYLWMGFGISDLNPVDEAEYIKKHFPKSRIGNTYNQGAYLLWKLWPNNKVFFDARHFPYRKQSDEFFAFLEGKNIIEFTSKYPCDLWCIGLQHSSLLMGLMVSKDWKLAYYGKNAAILVRKGIKLPENAPRLNSAIFNLKNLQTAINLITFATNIGDFQTAEKLMAVTTETFTYKPQENAVRWSSYYVKGIKAYNEKKYAVAAVQLGLLGDPPDYIRFIHTNCYQFLTQKAWDDGKLVEALRFAQKSLALVPDNPYSLYNKGVISWWLEINSSDIFRMSVTKDSLDKAPWSSYLLNFLDQSRHAPDLVEFRKTAQAILDNRQMERPLRLLIPNEPRERKLFVDTKVTHKEKNSSFSESASSAK